MKRLPKPSGRTLRKLISQFQRLDGKGKQGLRVRELTHAMHIAAKTLEIALDEPERLSMASLFGLAELLKVEPAQLVADIYYQVSLRPAFGHTPTGGRPRVHRSHEAATDAAANSEQTREETDPTLPCSKKEDELPPPSHGIFPENDVPSASSDDFPSDTATQIPYAEATFPQRTLALASVQEELKHHFSALPLLRWSTELDALQPNLWVEGEEITINYEDLVRLTQRLSWAPELPALDPPIYGPQSLYLARRLSEYAYQAVLALAEMEQNPLAYGKHTRSIILKLAAGNGVAEEVLRAITGYSFREGQPDESLSSDQIPGCPAVQVRVVNLAWSRGKPAGFPPSAC